MTYRELQAALKAFRSQGLDVQVKLTASFDTLQAEYNRLSAIAQPASPEPPQEPPSQQPQQPQEQMVVEPETSSKVDLTYSTNLPKNEPYSHQENSQSFVEQEFESITVEPEVKVADTISNLQENNGSNGLNIGKQLSKPLEALPDKEKQIQARSTYWIDGTELGQNLNHTQAQALRNLEDGINWLRSLAGKLKAFESGFREGWQNTPVKQQARLKQSNVIPIERSHRLPKPLPIPLVA
jgi:type I site-specific restriction endonuclease